MPNVCCRQEVLRETGTVAHVDGGKEQGTRNFLSKKAKEGWCGAVRCGAVRCYIDFVYLLMVALMRMARSHSPDSFAVSIAFSFRPAASSCCTCCTPSYVWVFSRWRVSVFSGLFVVCCRCSVPDCIETKADVPLPLIAAAIAVQSALGFVWNVFMSLQIDLKPSSTGFYRRRVPHRET